MTNEQDTKTTMLTFGEIAERISTGPSNTSVDRVLERLFKAFWNGEFEEIHFAVHRYFALRNVDAQTTDERTSLEGLEKFEKPERCDALGYRRYIFSFLHAEAKTLRLPEIGPGEGSEVASFQELAYWLPKHYPPKGHLVMENIAIRPKEVERWARENERGGIDFSPIFIPIPSAVPNYAEAAPSDHIAGEFSTDDRWRSGPRRQKGRPRGAGSFEAADLPLLEEMHELRTGDPTLSVTAAARLVSEKAEGGGTPESKARRLAKRYGEKYRENGK